MNGDLQDSIDSAWTSYHLELAKFVSEMPEGEQLTLNAETGLDRGDGDTPWIALHSEADDVIVCTAVLDSYLYEGVEPPVGDDAALMRLGWATPASWTERGQLISRSMRPQRRGADDLVRRIVCAFREVWRVPHPAFLSAAAEGGNGRQFRTAADRRRPDTTAILPLDIDHLRALIVDLVGRYLACSMEDNDDVAVDDFALPVHVCFDHDATSVRLHAPLVSGVVVSAELSRTLSRLTSRWKNISFVVAGDQLFAGMTIDTRTFVPRLSCR